MSATQLQPSSVHNVSYTSTISAIKIGHRYTTSATRALIPHTKRCLLNLKLVWSIIDIYKHQQHNIGHITSATQDQPNTRALPLTPNCLTPRGIFIQIGSHSGKFSLSDNHTSTQHQPHKHISQANKTQSRPCHINHIISTAKAYNITHTRPAHKASHASTTTHTPRGVFIYCVPGKFRCQVARAVQGVTLRSWYVSACVGSNPTSDIFLLQSLPNFVFCVLGIS